MAVTVKMLIWATGGMIATRSESPGDKAARGFTLLELLAVLLVIGLLAGLAGLSIPPGDGGLRQESERLLGVSQLASEEAVLRNRQFGLRLFRLDSSTERYGYEWFHWDGREWQVLLDPPYERHDMAEGLRLRVEVDDLELSLPLAEAQDAAGDDSARLPQLRFFSSGESDRFLVEILHEVADQEPTRRSLRSDAFGRLQLGDTDEV